MLKQCQNCNQQFEITDADLIFYQEASPIFNGKKILIPRPKFCPTCRRQRRLTFRNERTLYGRKCDLTGKNIISVYSPDKPFTVFHHTEWEGDKWNALDYAQPFDFNKTFFEQFSAQQLKVPKKVSTLTMAWLIVIRVKVSSF